MKQIDLGSNLITKRTHKVEFLAQLVAHGLLPDESTILKLRPRLEKHKLPDQILVAVNALLTKRGLVPKVGIAMDATLIPVPSYARIKTRLATPRCIRAGRAAWGITANKACIGMVKHQI